MAGLGEVVRLGEKESEAVGPRDRPGGSSFLCPPTPGFLAPTSMFTFVVLVITIVICLCHVCFGHFKYLSAHNYKVRAGSGAGGVRPRAEVFCGGGVQGQTVLRGCWGATGAEDKDVSSPSLDPLRLNTQRQMP